MLFQSSRFGTFYAVTKGNLKFKIINHKVALVPVASIVYIFSDLKCNARERLVMPECHHLDILQAIEEVV